MVPAGVDLTTFFFRAGGFFFWRSRGRFLAGNAARTSRAVGKMHRRLAQLQIDSENGPLMSWSSPRSWTRAQSGRQHQPSRFHVLKTVTKKKSGIFFTGPVNFLQDHSGCFSTIRKARRDDNMSPAGQQSLFEHQEPFASLLMTLRSGGGSADPCWNHLDDFTIFAVHPAWSSR